MFEQLNQQIMKEILLIYLMYYQDLKQFIYYRQYHYLKIPNYLMILINFVIFETFDKYLHNIFYLNLVIIQFLSKKKPDCLVKLFKRCS